MFFSSCFEPVSFIILVWKSYLRYSNQNAYPSRSHHWLKFSIMKARLAQWRQIFFSPYLSLRSMAVLPGALLSVPRVSVEAAKRALTSGISSPFLCPRRPRRPRPTLLICALSQNHHATQAGTHVFFFRTSFRSGTFYTFYWQFLNILFRTCYFKLFSAYNFVRFVDITHNSQWPECCFVASHLIKSPGRFGWLATLLDFQRFSREKNTRKYRNMSEIDTLVEMGFPRNRV